LPFAHVTGHFLAGAPPRCFAALFGLSRPNRGPLLYGARLVHRPAGARAGTLTLAAPGAGASNLDNIREAITLIRLNARSEPNAIVLNPTDAHNIDLLKVNNEPNNFAGPGPLDSSLGPRRAWGLPIVGTDAFTAGTTLIGDFSKAVLFDRQSLAVTLGTINDQFIRDMVTVLGEVRAGFGAIRPVAFVRATLAYEQSMGVEQRRLRPRIPRAPWGPCLAEKERLRARVGGMHERVSDFKRVIKRQRLALQRCRREHE
jgi:Phage capsid family